MNVVREINRINEKELDLALSGASWHDEYKDSAYIFVGGLNNELTEGDVITIFSQYGEILDINMPRDKETGKPKGFAFLMYEDQRSTILAVDNLNGAQVLERTLRVDHVKNYKQKRTKNVEGEWEDPEEQSMNAKPEMIAGEEESSSEEDSGPEIDPEDPMYEYLVQQRREAKALKKSGSKHSKSKKSKHANETPEERAARKERKRAKKEKKKEGKGKGRKGEKGDEQKSVEELLAELERGGPAAGRRSRSASRSPPPRRRERSATPPRRGGREEEGSRTPPTKRRREDDREGRDVRMRTRSRSPPPPRDVRMRSRSRSPVRRRSPERERYSRDEGRNRSRDDRRDRPRERR